MNTQVKVKAFTRFYKPLNPPKLSLPCKLTLLSAFALGLVACGGGGGGGSSGGGGGTTMDLIPEGNYSQLSIVSLDVEAVVHRVRNWRRAPQPMAGSPPPMRSAVHLR